MVEIEDIIKILMLKNRYDLIKDLIEKSIPKGTFLEEYVLEKIVNYTLIGITQGETQSGKSTFNHFFMNNLSRLKFKEKWDYSRFCGRSLLEFAEIVKQFNNGYFITYEEPETDVSIDNWYDDFNHAFNLIVSTQGYKHNFYNLVLPASVQLSNRQRYFIKLGIEVIKKIPELKRVIIRPTIYSRTFWRLDDNDLKYSFPPSSFIDYSDQDLKDATVYTNWIISTLKEPLMNEIVDGLKNKKLKRERIKNLDKEEDKLINSPDRVKRKLEASEELITKIINSTNRVN